jgi:hypothetical protein
MIGQWHVGKTLLVLAQEKRQHQQERGFLGNREFYIPVFSAYLGELERHLSRKANIDQLPPVERKALLDDAICAAAYVRSICRLAPLWKEHQEVGLEVRPGITMENLAYIKKQHNGGESFSGGFTVDKAVAALAVLDDSAVGTATKGA